MTHRLTLLGFIVAAVLLSAVPVVHVPLEWFETLCHESSHALMAWMTGGQVSRLELHWDGSGLTWSAGGARVLVSFAGYAGAIGWGMALYALGSHVTDRAARTVTGVLLALGLMESLTWLAFQVSSWLIMGLLMGLLALMLWPRAARLVRPCLRFIGIYVLLSGIRAPTYLLEAGIGDNDAQALAHMTWVPSVLWVGLWVLMGLGALVLLYRQAGRRDRRPVDVLT